MLTDEEVRLAGIFLPHAFSKYTMLLNGSMRFAHYSSAEAAIKIIQNNEIWMRNALTMNDVSEFRYGLGSISFALHQTKEGQEFKGALSKFAPEILNQVISDLSNWVPVLEGETYAACFSEHAPEGTTSEDALGRLSMWRAYGGENGVALIFGGGNLGQLSPDLGVTLTPVAYLDQRETTAQIGAISEKINMNTEWLKTIDRDTVHHFVYMLFRSAMHALKHPAFHEEREWRLFHSPQHDGNLWAKIETEVIRGVPQQIAKISLNEDKARGVTGVSISEILHKVIIGPTLYPSILWETFVKELRSQGVPDSEKKVVISGVPLRR